MLKTLYWYFSQLFYQAKVNLLVPNSKYKIDDIFKLKAEGKSNLDDPNQYRFQRALEDGSEILSFTHEPKFYKNIVAGIQYGVEVLQRFLYLLVTYLVYIHVGKGLPTYCVTRVVGRQPLAAKDKQSNQSTLKTL